jgi:hypothetical protein
MFTHFTLLKDFLHCRVNVAVLKSEPTKNLHICPPIARGHVNEQRN